METISYINDYRKTIFYDKYLTNTNNYLIIVHGSIEHIGRYKEFCEYMQNSGVNCYAMDLLGHGRSNNGFIGFYDYKESGFKIIKSDIDYLYSEIKKKNKNASISILGHSMGSFIVRDYLADTDNEFNSVIISGTIKTPSYIKLANTFIDMFGLIKGTDYRSKKIHKMLFKSLSSRKVKNKYLTNDRAEVNRYTKDPYCNFIVTIDYVSEMLACMDRIKSCKTKNKQNILFISGELDPLALKQCKGVKSVARNYKVNNEVKEIYYKGMYHEVLKELDNDIVYQDILTYLI